MANIEKTSLKKCEAHGLMYDPSKAIGCVLCKKNSRSPSLTSLPPGMEMPDGKKTVAWLLVTAVVLVLVFIFRERLGDNITMLLAVGGMFVGMIGVIVQAFRMSMLWGTLSILFFFPASIVFAILYRGPAVRYLIIMIAGFTIAATGNFPKKDANTDIHQETVNMVD